MSETSASRRDRFGRMFPPRVEKLIDQLRLLANCTNKSSYEWNQDLVHDAWLEIASHLKSTAKLYDIDFDVLVDGDQVEYADRKSKRKTS